jgi:hypothetical protein
VVSFRDERRNIYGRGEEVMKNMISRFEMIKVPYLDIYAVAEYYDVNPKMLYKASAEYVTILKKNAMLSSFWFVKESNHFFSRLSSFFGNIPELWRAGNDEILFNKHYSLQSMIVYLPPMINNQHYILFAEKSKTPFIRLIPRSIFVQYISDTFYMSPNEINRIIAGTPVWDTIPGYEFVSLWHIGFIEISINN